MVAVSDSLPPAVTLIFVGALGLIFGSFVTALSYRLPRGISIAKGRSGCPACGTTLSPRDLIPVVSWILSRGACRVCGTKIAWRYPAIEIAMAALFIAAAVMIDAPLRLVLVLAATPVAVALAVIDIEHRRLPNTLLAILAGLALAFRFHTDRDLATAAMTAAIVFMAAVALDRAGRRLFKQGLGMGDAKAMAITALAFPPLALSAVLCGAGILGLLTGLFWRRDPAEPQYFPFGPGLLAALWGGLVLL